MVSSLFLDTSVLVGGIVGFQQNPQAAQHLLDAIADQRIDRPLTAWHCCLEFFAVVTRVPLEFRVTPQDAKLLIEEEILARFEVSQLPDDRFGGFFGSAVENSIVGARVYDYHLAAVAHAADASAIVTDNPKHFRIYDPHLQVLTSDQAVVEYSLDAKSD